VVLNITAVTQLVATEQLTPMTDRSGPECRSRTLLGACVTQMWHTYMPCMMHSITIALPCLCWLWFVQ